MMNRTVATIFEVMLALTLAVKAADTNAIARLHEADNLAAAGKFGPAAAMFTAVLPAVSNGTHECYTKARLAACLFETSEYARAIALCDELANKWPRGSAKFSPFMIKADCLTALGRTNEAVRAYRDHYTHHNPDVRVTDEDIRKRMETTKRKAVPTTGTVPPEAGAFGVQ